MYYSYFLSLCYSWSKVSKIVWNLWGSSATDSAEWWWAVVLGLCYWLYV